MKMMRIVTLVEVEDDVTPSEIQDWVGGCLDNADYDILDEMEIDQDKVSIGISYFDGYVKES